MTVKFVFIHIASFVFFLNQRIFKLILIGNALNVTRTVYKMQKFRDLKQKFRVYSRQFRVSSRKLQVYSQKFRVYSQKFRCLFAKATRFYIAKALRLFAKKLYYFIVTTKISSMGFSICLIEMQ